VWYFVAHWMLIYVARIHEVNCVFSLLKYGNPCVYDVIISVLLLIREFLLNVHWCMVDAFYEVNSMCSLLVSRRKAVMLCVSSISE
jgi:hypothetical protein